MAKPSEKDRVRTWQGRTSEADKIYKKWNERFEVDRLEDVYIGDKQWTEDENPNGNKYVINKIFPTVEIGIPSLLFYNPTVKIKPRPARSDDKMSDVEGRAKLQADTINTFISDRKLNFKPITTLALKESFFSYAMIEVGYTADIIDNPLAQKPELVDEENKDFATLERIPQSESLFIKRIPTKQFRVGANSQNILSHNDWCGYYEYQRIQDVKANPKYKNTTGLKASGRQIPNVAETVNKEDRDAEGFDHKDMIKVWKIWDIRTSKRYVMPDTGDKFFIDGETYDILPFASYKRYEIRDSWYPLPPLYNWLNPQREINDIRDKRKVHRKRFLRRYLVQDGQIADNELEKLETGEDGVYAHASRPDAIQAVPDAPLDPGILRDEVTADQDFREVTGIGGEQRGDEDPNTTATQANIVELRSRIRETYSRQNVGEWLAEIATLMLKMAIKNMSLPFWIKMNTDLQGPEVATEAMQVAEQWKRITAQDLGDLQLDISVDVASLSPISEESERMSWTQVLGLLTNPQLLAVLMNSDVLLRKTLSYYNIKSQAEIDEIKKAGQAMLVMVAGMAAQQNGVGGPQGAPAPGPTPGNMDIQGQLMQQLPGGMAQ